MFKRVEPRPAPIPIDQFPHCDQRVLHAPGECEYCDEHPDWQALRFAWGIAFTGYEPGPDELQCPATVRRPLGKINNWVGNVATSLIPLYDATHDVIDKDDIGRPGVV